VRANEQHMWQILRQNKIRDNRFDKHLDDCHRHYANIVFNARHKEYIEPKKEEKYKTKNLVVRDREKSYQEFVSKA
jgi:hypothetical protein